MGCRKLFVIALLTAASALAQPRPFGDLSGVSSSLQGHGSSGRMGPETFTRSANLDGKNYEVRYRVETDASCSIPATTNGKLHCTADIAIYRVEGNGDLKFIQAIGGQYVYGGPCMEDEPLALVKLALGIKPEPLSVKNATTTVVDDKWTAVVTEDRLKGLLQRVSDLEAAVKQLMPKGVEWSAPTTSRTIR